MINYFYYSDNIEYPVNPPYMPTEIYPEYPYKDDVYINTDKNIQKNLVYEAIRNLFIGLDLDEKNIGSSRWNPLGKYIEPGQTVLLKPNLVSHFNSSEPDMVKGMDCLITHPSVVRCIFDYTYIALKGKGKIIIADAPVQGCNFKLLMLNTGYGELFHYIQQKSSDMLNIKIADLREVTYVRRDGKALQSERSNLEFGSHTIDLGKESFFCDIKGNNRLRVTDYAKSDTVRHHIGGRHEYKISDALLQADVIISLPKPKSHRIAGYTAALKNMIGVNARKEYLPHHRKGKAGKRGDEYLASHSIQKWMNSTGNDIRNWAVKKGYDRISFLSNEICRKIGRRLDSYETDRKKFGMWYGNDTIWRTILDVNHIINYVDKAGNIKDEPQRKLINIGDMVVCGDHEGPLHPSYKKVGGILFADNSVLFDLIVVKLMGFDWQKFPTLVNAVKDEKLNGLVNAEEHNEMHIVDGKINELVLTSNDSTFNKRIVEINDSDTFKFSPTCGWYEYLCQDN